jgi:hypothetical protein
MLKLAFDPVQGSLKRRFVLVAVNRPPVRRRLFLCAGESIAPEDERRKKILVNEFAFSRA